MKPTKLVFPHIFSFWQCILIVLLPKLCTIRTRLPSQRQAIPTTNVGIHNSNSQKTFQPITEMPGNRNFLDKSNKLRNAIKRRRFCSKSPTYQQHLTKNMNKLNLVKKKNYSPQRLLKFLFAVERYIYFTYFLFHFLPLITPFQYSL